MFNFIIFASAIYAVKNRKPDQLIPAAILTVVFIISSICWTAGFFGHWFYSYRYYYYYGGYSLVVTLLYIGYLVLLYHTYKTLKNEVVGLVESALFEFKSPDPKFFFHHFIFRLQMTPKTHHVGNSKRLKTQTFDLGGHWR